MFDLYVGDALERLKEIPDNSVNCCITSPPYYGLRDYGTGEWIGGDPNCPHKRLNKFSEKTITGHKQEELVGNVGDAIYKTVCPICGAVRVDKQIGLETTPEQYIEKLVEVFREVRRVLTDDGTLWVNIGDTYYGSGGGRGSNYHDGRTDVVQSGNKGFNDMKYAPVLTKHRDDLKPKDLIGIPWMLAFALRKDGWYLRQDIIWEKPNPMPESVKDRFTKNHEYIFMLSKNKQYYFNHDNAWERSTSSPPIRMKNKSVDLWGLGSEVTTDPKVSGNKYGESEYFDGIYSGNKYEYSDRRKIRDVWNIPVSSTKEAHFATYPIKLVENCLLVGCPVNGTVLDPFNGSGTTGIVTINNGMNYIGIELNKDYVEITKNRVHNECDSNIQVEVK